MALDSTVVSWVDHVVRDALEVEAEQVSQEPRHGPPMGARVPLEGAGGHRRGVADTQGGGSLVLLLEVSPGQSGQLLAILLLDGAPLAVELLYFVEPGDAVGQPGGRGLEAILSRELG